MLSATNIIPSDSFEDGPLEGTRWSERYSRARFYFHDSRAVFFTVKRRCIIDGLHARKDLARTFHRETDRCLLDEIGKPDRASRAGGDLSGMKIEEEHPDAARQAGREISVVSAPRGNASRFLIRPFHPRVVRYAASRRASRTHTCTRIRNPARFLYSVKKDAVADARDDAR